MPQTEVLIVGGGLAGLCCALRLEEEGIPYLVLEASDRPGGRVRTDEQEGFLLDRGFQVLLTAYPEARRVLDYAALELRPFFPGALVRFGGRFHRVADPWRRPLAGLAGLANPIGSLGDKFRVARWRRLVRRGSPEDLFRRPETTSLGRLRELGFGEEMVDRFFRPFFGGVFFERDLRTSSRMLEFLFRMFAEGETAVPARGMGEIPAQIARRLPAARLRFGESVRAIAPSRAWLASGEELAARVIVLAVEGPEAARLLQRADDGGSRGVTAISFACERAPLAEPILVLDGDGMGPANHAVVMSEVSGAYAPPGHSLVVATVLGTPRRERIEAALRNQMREWFGAPSDAWRLLRWEAIVHAQPERAQLHVSNAPPSTRLARGLHLCGDSHENVSIHGAMLSGRRAAEGVLEDLAK